MITVLYTSPSNYSITFTDTDNETIVRHLERAEIDKERTESRLTDFLHKSNELARDFNNLIGNPDIIKETVWRKAFRNIMEDVASQFTSSLTDAFNANAAYTTESDFTTNLLEIVEGTGAFETIVQFVEYDLIAEMDISPVVIDFDIIRSGVLDKVSSAEWEILPIGNFPVEASDFGGSFPTNVVNFLEGESSKTEQFTIYPANPSANDRTFKLKFINLVNTEFGSKKSDTYEITYINFQGFLPLSRNLNDPQSIYDNTVDVMTPFVVNIYPVVAELQQYRVTINSIVFDFLLQESIPSSGDWSLTVTSTAGGGISASNTIFSGGSRITANSMAIVMYTETDGGQVTTFVEVTRDEALGSSVADDFSFIGTIDTVLVEEIIIPSQRSIIELGQDFFIKEVEQTFSAIALATTTLTNFLAISGDNDSEQITDASNSNNGKFFNFEPSVFFVDPPFNVEYIEFEIESSAVIYFECQVVFESGATTYLLDVIASPSGFEVLINGTSVSSVSLFPGQPYIYFYLDNGGGLIINYFDNSSGSLVLDYQRPDLPMDISQPTVKFTFGQTFGNWSLYGPVYEPA